MFYLCSRSVSSLRKLNVEQFMALPTSDEDEAPPPTKDKVKTSRKRRRASDRQKTQTRKMCTPDSSASELSDFLEEEDFHWTVEDEAEWETEGDGGDEGDMGVLEPRPPEITSWKEKVSGMCMGYPV